MRAKSWIIALMAAGAVAAQAGVTTVNHRYLFDGDATDSVGGVHGTETVAGTNLEAPQYTNDIPVGTVAGAPTLAMDVGMNHGTKKSGFTLNQSVINKAAGSYSVWVKPDTMGNGRYWILAGNLNTGGPTLFTPTSTELKLQCGKVGGTGAAYTATFSMAANQWQHIAVTWETNTFTAKVYIDGTLVGSTPFDSSTIQPSSSLRIGGFNLADDANQLPNQVDGKYYDLQFYDAMLTSNEVVSLASNPGSAIIFTPPAPELTHRYTFTDSNATDWIGSVDGAETTAGTNLEAPQYTTDIPVGTVAGAPTRSMEVGMNHGTKKSGFELDGSVINTVAGSCSVWVKSDTMGNGRYWILANDLNTGGPTLLTPTSTEMRLLCGKTGGTGAAYTATFSMVSNQWQHVAVTWETNTFTAKVYLDGALVGTTPFDAATLQPNLLRIGGFNLVDDANQLSNQVDGKYYDLQFYDGVLSAADVAGLHTNPGTALPAKLSPLLVMPAVFHSGMVLQAGRPILVWGVANPGETVSVLFGGATVTAVVSTYGKWQVELEALPASSAGRTLTVESSDGSMIMYSDVRVGNAGVWVPEGDSAGIPEAWMSSIGNPPGSIHFDFEAGELEGWTTSQLDILSHTGGVVTVTGVGTDPRLIRTALYIQSGLVNGLAVRLRTSQPGNLSLLWGSNQSDVFSSSRQKTVAVSANGAAFQTVYFDLSSNPRKGRLITQLRLDLDFPSGVPVEIDWIRTSDGDYDRDGLSDWLEGFGDSDGDGLADFEDPDSNGNGLSDGVEFLGGADAYSAVEAGIDSDGDGAEDRFEAIAGTDPHNANESPRASIHLLNDQVEIAIDGKASRSYTLETRTDLLTGSWTEASPAFRSSADQPLAWSLPSNAPNAFYRVNISGIMGAFRPNAGNPSGASIETPGKAILDNGTLRIEAAVANGASLTHFSGPSGENLINLYDQGRLIQQSYYAGQRLDRTAEGQSTHWSPWAWNPIQGGDSSRAASEVLDVSVAEFGGGLFTRTVPLLWDMKTAEKAQCLIDQWNEFEPGMSNVVRVTCRLIVDRDDDDIWGGPVSRGQELPATYFIRNLSKVVSYTGSAPWSGDAVSELSYSPGPPWFRTNPSEHWMAQVDPATDVGVGLYSPVESVHWYYGAAGNPPGGSNSGATMHMAPIGAIQMDRHHVLVYRYWLIYGDLDEIRNRVYELHRLHPHG